MSELKQKRKSLSKHITISQLSQSDKFSKLATEKKHFIDTIKMIAYRAETALINIIRPHMARKEEARSVVRQIFNTEINLIPDEQNKHLIVELHNLTNQYSDHLAQKICDVLNETEVTFPGSEMKILYKMVSGKNLRGQEF